jgi:hypothetical protein
MRAFQILIGELDPSKEKGYLASLYEGIDCCDSFNESSNLTKKHEQNGTSIISFKHLPKKHLHLTNSKDFICNLICKAELEIHGK